MAPIKSTVMSRRDLEFLLFEWLAVDELTKRPRFAEHSRETFSDVLDLCEDLATRYFAPHNKKSDQNEPSFVGTTVTVIPEVKQAIDAFAAAAGREIVVELRPALADASNVVGVEPQTLPTTPEGPVADSAGSSTHGERAS